MKPKPAHYKGTYHVQARRVRERANREPSTRCWRCGLTLQEIRRYKNPKARWTAGHTIDSTPGAPLLPECSPCNFAAGARLGNTRRNPRRTSRTW